MEQDIPKPVRDAIAGALADLRHVIRVGTLSPHDQGLIEVAVRRLERVISGESYVRLQGGPSANV